METNFIQLTAERLQEMLSQSALLGARQALQLAGLPVKDLYTRTELNRRYGRRSIDDAIEKSLLTPRQLPSMDGENKRILYSETEYLSLIK